MTEQEMRERFEVWARERQWGMKRTERGYREWQTDTAWLAWQACWPIAVAAGRADQREEDAKVCEAVMAYEEDNPGATFAAAIRSGK